MNTKEQIKEILRGDVTIDEQTVTDIVYKWDSYSGQLSEHDVLRIAEAILNLRDICPNCKGSGYNKNGKEIKRDRKTGHLKNYACPTCKGTGGERLLAVVCENQEVPIYSYHSINQKQDSDWLYKQAQRDMTTPKDGYVWKKVVIK